VKVDVGGFDWDDGNSAKCQKHGVSIPEIESVFQRPFAVVPDVEHSNEEERLIAIGISDQGRYILIVFTRREREGEMFIRPISARYMHQKEVDYYEEEIAQAHKR
jgi:hypothetical protein